MESCSQCVSIQININVTTLLDMTLVEAVEVVESSKTILSWDDCSTDLTDKRSSQQHVYYTTRTQAGNNEQRYVCAHTHTHQVVVLKQE